MELLIFYGFLERVGDLSDGAIGADVWLTLSSIVADTFPIKAGQ